MMPLWMKLVVTYMTISFGAGLVLMLYDAMQPHNNDARARVVMALYLPPLGILGGSLLAMVLMNLWQR